MTAELLVNVTPSETRVAYIDGGILQEIHIEREARRGIVGNIYKGRVSRVLPGMQAAFVDIGLDKAAFLHASDIMPHTECARHLGTGPSGARSDGAGGERSAWH
ncbi:hypothetical protein TUM13735_37530 [Escherichia coli]|nr:hypothetical protein TUM13735_37530 [Escherichia coli]